MATNEIYVSIECHFIAVSFVFKFFPIFFIFVRSSFVFLPSRGWKGSSDTINKEILETRLWTLLLNLCLGRMCAENKRVRGQSTSIGFGMETLILRRFLSTAFAFHLVKRFFDLVHLRMGATQWTGPG